MIQPSFEGDFSHLSERGVRFVQAQEALGMVGTLLASKESSGSSTVVVPKAVHPVADPRARELHVQPMYTGVTYDPDSL